MIISLIAAMGKNHVIGKDNKIPWHISLDFKRFKTLTKSSDMIMGRKTFESLPKILPGRRHLVVTRDKSRLPKDSMVIPCGSLNEALEKAETSEVFIIGGTEIFKEGLKKAHKLYLTFIEQDFEGDTFFPEFEQSKFKILENTQHEEGSYRFSFKTFERI